MHAYYVGWQIAPLKKVISKITDCEHVFWIIHIIIQMGIILSRTEIEHGKRIINYIDSNARFVLYGRSDSIYGTICWLIRSSLPNNCLYIDYFIHLCYCIIFISFNTKIYLDQFKHSLHQDIIGFVNSCKTIMKQKVKSWIFIKMELRNLKNECNNIKILH